MGKHRKEFMEGMPEAEEFKKLYLSQHGRGGQQVLADHFKISIATVYRLRILYGLPHLCSKEHPGRKAFRKQVKDLYYKHGSTERVAKALRISSQGVNKILREERVTLGPQKISNILSKPPGNGMGPASFNKACKNLYENGMTIPQIALELQVDQSSISKRLRAMNIELRQHHQLVPGGYPCVWCSKIMEQVWVASGSRRQRYCGARCKNRAKELMRYVHAERRIKALDQELRAHWGDDWKAKRQEILTRQCPTRINGAYYPKGRTS